MKKYLFACLFVLVGLMIVAPAFGQATATHRMGDWIDQYKIDDPGDDCHNKIIYFSHRVVELVVQESGIDYKTSKESLKCWSSQYEGEDCPTRETDPVLWCLEDIMIANNVVMGAPLTDLQEKAIYLAFWYEYKLKKVVTDSLAEMTLEEMNDLQKRRSLKYVLFGNGIDLTTSQAMAAARVNSQIVYTYNELALATVPLADRRLLKIFGEVGWFEE